MRVMTLRTAWWYVRRPRMYRELGRRLRHKLVPSSDREPAAGSSRSDEWCASLAVDTDEALSRLVGLTRPPSVRSLFPDAFAEADRSRKACPVEMGAPGDLDLLYHLANTSRARRIIETGVAFGWSSLVLLLSVAEHADGSVVSTDMPYVMRFGDEWVGCVVPDRLRARWQLLRYPDREGLPRALRYLPEIDLCHYDSHKSYRARLWAYPLLWNALRPGGYLVSDDIGDDQGFRVFCEQVGAVPTVVSGRTSTSTLKYVGVLRKPTADPISSGVDPRES